jgi:DtxR family Mn-dependent transcriptional regulator
MKAEGLVVGEGHGYRLTEAGRALALEVVRSHRLYETWLSRNTGVPAREWHERAHKEEHRLRGASLDEMADALGNPRFDPHGDPIPTREGELPPIERVPLAGWPDGTDAEVSHIEDEPAGAYHRVLQLGLVPGARLAKPLHQSDGSVCAWLEGAEVRIAADLVPLVHVVATVEVVFPVGLKKLDEILPGEEAVVHGLAAGCCGTERTRMLDLGLVPGTSVRCEFNSPFGFPRSYLIRGAMVALRQCQAAQVLVV